MMTTPESSVKVRSIWQKDEFTLAIEWTDLKTQEFKVFDLRRLCPCASCVDELSGQRKLDPAQLDPQVKPVSIHSVGRYAIGITFTDGHKTGIYTFSYLRQFS